MSGHNSPQSTLQRRSYHIRRESTVLKTNNKSIATRKRSNTDIDSRHYKKINNRNINRRFDSTHNKFDENKVETSFESIHFNRNNSENNMLLTDILHQFREIILPLQTEIKSLKQITVELQNQVNILKEENKFYRKHRPKSVYIDYESNTNYCNDFTYIPNLPGSYGITPYQSTITPNNKQQSAAITSSINPAYLFNQHSKTTISNAMINNYENDNYNEINTETKIKFEMEEDDLEINIESNTKYIDKNMDNDMSSVTQIYLELSENDHITTPENKYYKTKSIEQTYHQNRNSMKSMSESINSPIKHYNQYNIDNYNTINKQKMNDMFI
eukprot:17634_1